MSTPGVKKPFRTLVLYSAGHLGSAVILNQLISSPEYEVVGVARAKAVTFSRKGLKRLRKHLISIGWRFGWLLLWQQLIQTLSYLFTGLFRGERQGLKPTWRLALSHNLPVFQCEDINSKEALDFICRLQPDIIISAYFTQILKKDIIELPNIGILNVHPGWLPAYKGAMAYFWVLKNGGDQAGVTVHWIDEGIDTGTILRRHAFEITPGMTQQNVLEQTAIIGAELLTDIGHELATQGKATPAPLDEQEPDQYYPMPGSEAFDSYFKQRRFFRIRDIFHLIQQRKRRKHNKNLKNH